MKRIMIMVLLFVFLCPIHTYAFDISDIKPAIKKETITIEDIKALLNLNIYKYKLRIPPNHKLNIVLKDIVNNKIIFNHSPTINDDYNYTMKISFTREDDLPGDAFKSEHEKLVYSVNWNYQRVFSGTISNFLKDHKSRSLEINSNDFGQIISGKASIIKFYTWQGGDSEEELVAELYLTVQVDK